MLDFSGCSDLRVAPDPSQPGTVVNCSSRTAYAYTDMNGEVTFRIVGNAAGAPGSAANCLRVYADGVPLPSPIVSALDLDGRNGADPIDLSIAYADIVSGQYRPRVDYDADGDSDALDLCFLYKAILARGSTSSGAVCP
jgi:hypothetical protein